jgi:CRP-like cAMP-binding protein
MFCLLYNLILVPVRISWNWNAALGDPMFVFEALIDWFFVADIFLNFRTGFVAHEGTSGVVMDPAMIAKEYFKSWFIVDFVSSVPIDFFLTVFMASDGNSRSDAAGSVKMVRILRLTKLMKLFRVLKVARFLDSFQDHYPIDIGMWRACHMLVITFYVAHLIGCFFFFVAEEERSRTGADTWIQQSGIDGRPINVQYLTAMYWSFTTITTAGYGDITPQTDSEKGFVIFAMVIGGSMFGYVLGNVSDVIANRNAAESMVNAKMEALNSYMKSRALPHDLQVDIRKYYRYFWKKKSVFDEQVVLVDLSASLKSKLLMFMHKEIICKIELFDQVTDSLGDADINFVSLVVQNLNPVFYSKREVILHQGAEGDVMFFVAKGRVSVWGKDQRYQIAMLKVGQYFGEIALLDACEVPELGIKANRRSATCIASSFVDLYSLSRAALSECFIRFDEVQSHMENHALARIEQIKRLHEENASQKFSPATKKLSAFRQQETVR